jgi:hypothetical protein
MNAAQIAIGENWDGSLITEITTNRFIQVVKAINKAFRRKDLRFTNEYFRWENIKWQIKWQIRQEYKTNNAT